MPPEMQALIITAVSIACLHTLTGPDHYLPFIALSKSRGWTIGKTIAWTVACGLGHVLSSVALGLGGAALGWSLSKINFLENVRGGIAGWVMLLFGVLYMLWGWYRLYTNKQHKHFDADEQGLYVYEHRHGVAVLPAERFRVTPWVMFIIFILGPCEPMIPLLYYPAAQKNVWGMMILILLYTFFTLLTMLGIVLLGYFGIGFSASPKAEKYVHVLGGVTIFVCGVGMVWMGW